LTRQVIPYLNDLTLADADIPLLVLLSSRARTLVELAAMMTPFLVETFSYDEKGERKHLRPEILDAFSKWVRDVMEVSEEDWTAEELESRLRQRAESEEVKAGRLIHPTRLFVSGRTVGPGLFELLVVAGPKRVKARLERGLEHWKNRMS